MPAQLARPCNTHVTTGATEESEMAGVLLPGRTKGTTNSFLSALASWVRSNNDVIPGGVAITPPSGERRIAKNDITDLKL